MPAHMEINTVSADGLRRATNIFQTQTYTNIEHRKTAKTQSASMETK